MKHLKMYEERKYSYNEGDYIVLLKADDEDIEYGFNVGEIYPIVQRLTIRTHVWPYKLENSNGETTHVKKSQIRLATDEEVAMHKYNL